ncbi:hypothetical protein COY87_04845 [Candidatus Roizmanbacteria bacterium CG_4_10_14_0_8_um_filter_33_9]|uniref:VTT domain-containing protein n=1 Tax=Candidatus Roizmanbacteria bacterium CG_4_10_14_0_8_um_filter_33_9 TaxID=1974826 RepID=A0A2M7QH94_9BACT|nr:MAG: hypothetical protein COY87_04845 [Candidatus Roizmanbacteria bacterium CG_4_10_14_0_8_um_filter_33_9]
MNLIIMLVNFILHIDVHLGQIISTYGTFTYIILFLIIFCETGLVFTPFLPGDSLLFAAGAFAALGSLNITLLFIILYCAVIIGDNTNYWIGYFFGKKMVDNPKIPIDEKHIKKTNEFFHIYGGKAIILGRFMPFIRTFTPFVAGVGRMNYSQFLTYDILGGLLWIGIGTFSGYFFGSIPFVRKNFSLVIIGVICVSLIPFFFELIKHKLKKHKK